MLINKTDYDLKYRLGLIADHAKPNIEFKKIDEGVERVTVKGGTIFDRKLLEQSLKFSISLYHNFNIKEKYHD